MLGHPVWDGVMTTTAHGTPERLDEEAGGREHVLLVCDGGPASAAAVRWLIDHVGDRAVRVEVLGVVAPDAHDAEERLRGIRAMSELLAIVSPAIELTVTESAEDSAARLIGAPGALLVIGAHRADAASRKLVQDLVDDAAGPVVVVPSEWICRQGPVVVGIGAEDRQTATLAFAEHEAALRRGEVRMIHSWDMAGPGEIPPSWDFDTESIPERQRRALAHLAALERDSRPELVISSEASQGRVVGALSDAARTASLLVVGRSHRSAAMRALFGSTAEGVLAQLPCPVAVVP